MTDPTAEMVACERVVWAAPLAGDPNEDERLLLADITGVYANGVFGRDANVAQLAGGPTIARNSLDDIRTRAIGTDQGLLVYRATYLRNGHVVPEVMHASSLWQRTAKGWINIFSQDTPADPKRSVP